MQLSILRLKNTVLKVLSVMVCLLVTTNVMAQEKFFPSVIGKWVTFDEKTQKPSSVISIFRRGDNVEGKIVKIFPVPGVKRIDNCQSCRGAEKNKPILGLTIIKEMQCANGICHSGTITDPRNGKVYHATMRLVDRGYLLKVRGYIGISLFGKTVVWRRLLPNKKAG